MKAIGFHSFGSPDVLQVMTFEDPQAGPGQVRVRVKAAGVQPADLAVRTGWTPPGATVQFPQIVGNEFAGIVDQIGEGVTGFSIGSKVIGFRMLECYAEYVVADAEQIVSKPAGMPWEAAGVMSASGQTAHTALRTLGIGHGDTVLIHAAAGGVGTFAVQLALAWGATVIGTASERNHEYLRSLGAIPVAYGEGLVDRVRALAPDGVSAAFDAVGGEAVHASVELVSDRNRIGTIAAFELAEQMGIRGIRSQRSAARLAELAELYGQGKLRVHIWKSFPLEQAANAHREVATGHVRGKVVLTVD
ncbi:NADP-dependent oxidoreductase [Paenibacillus sp. MBLB4367]|uniref:NADP-dependent oxidoreductase n=1 Tax=Paenibacillus sp. MBLB4367 TaxID=3384767 RepID=UPI00390822A5